MRKVVLVAGCSAALLLAAYLILWMTTPPLDREFKANYGKLQVGMTEKTVEEILGGPATGYSLVISSAPGEERVESYRKSWCGPNEERITLSIDQSGVVKSMAFSTPEDDADYFREPETFLMKLRRRLGL